MIFILVHSIFKLHPVYQDNLSLIMHYIKRITKSLKDYTFESHKNFNSYTVSFHLQTCNHTRKHLEAQKQPNLGGDSPLSTKMRSSSFKTKKNLLQDTKIFHSKAAHYVIQR